MAPGRGASHQQTKPELKAWNFQPRPLTRERRWDGKSINVCSCLREEASTNPNSTGLGKISRVNTGVYREIFHVAGGWCPPTPWGQKLL